MHDKQFNRRRHPTPVVPPAWRGRFSWPSLFLFVIATAARAQTDSATLQVQLQTSAGIHHAAEWKIAAPAESLIAAVWFESFRPNSTVCLFMQLRDSSYASFPLVAGGDVPALCAARLERVPSVTTVQVK